MLHITGPLRAKDALQVDPFQGPSQRAFWVFVMLGFTPAMYGMEMERKEVLISP